MYGPNLWTIPNRMSFNDHLYQWDVSQNARFPASVRTSTTPTVDDDLTNKKYVDSSASSTLSSANSYTDTLSAKQEKMLKEMIESGSNENGSWTKWSDGTMICRNKVDNIAIETKQNMSNKNIIYYGYVNDGWTYFPQEFIEPPTTILNLNTSSNCFGIQPYELQYSDRPPGFYPLSVNPTLTGVISISYIAIGKWK